MINRHSDVSMELLFPAEWNTWKAELEHCMACPRQCGVNRFYETGYCKTDAWCNISSICVHRGEEPSVSGPGGICNVFFTHCNLQCLYCQNHQISRLNEAKQGTRISLADTTRHIISLLDSGCRGVGFVSPGHQLVQMKAIIRAIRHAGRNPVFVYNSNGYDTADTLRSLEGLIDVFLPDFKYIDDNLALRWSDASNYAEVAKSALREMFRQKGSSVVFGDDGLAESGLIIRHLVLPGQVQNSIDVLQFIAEELSPRVYVSLMSQYYPTSLVTKHPELSRRIYVKEYDRVRSKMQELGMFRGWVQELASHSHYRPDFGQDHPFEH